MGVKVNSTRLKWILAACFYGLAQGLVWSVASLICVLCYTDIIKPPTVHPDDDDLISSMVLSYIYHLFLSDSYNLANEEVKVYITPKAFFSLMLIYEIFSVLWFLLSIWILVLWFQQNKCPPLALQIWSCIVFLFSLLDFIFFILLILDKSYLLDAFPELVDDPKNYVVSWAFTITIHLAMRGYVVWIINILFAAFIVYFSIQLTHERNEVERSPMDIIYGYENPQNQNHATPPHITRPNITSHNNSEPIARNPSETTRAADQLSMNNGILRKAESINSFKSHTKNDSKFKNNTAYNNNVAYDPSKPWIPHPDYTPPSSPTFRR